LHTIRVFKFKIDPGQTGALKALLSRLGRSNPRANNALRFDLLPMLHFASLTIFEDPTGDYGDELVFESSVDGSVDEYLIELLRVGGPRLQQICGYCQGYPNAAGFLEYIKAHALAPTLFHIGTPGRRVEHIKQERALRDAIDRVLDDPVNAAVPPRSLRTLVQNKVSAPPSPRLNWYPRFDDSEDAFYWLPEYSAATALVGPILLFPVNLVLAVLGFVYLMLAKVGASLPFVNIERDQHWSLRMKGHLGSSTFERLKNWGKYGALAVLILIASPFLSLWERLRQPPRAVRQQQRNLAADEKRKIRRLRRTEDRSGCIQNHLASIVRLRRGPFTKFFLRVKLKLLNAIYRTVFTRGTLAGVPGIHFGHWTLLDEGRDAKGRKDPGRILFLSNYDGTWDNYLDDFIAKLASGVGQIWGCGVGFPGVTDGEIFKNWARLQQTRTSVWYSAYPDLTVDAINNHSEIREGLFAPIDKRPKRLKAWLLRFGQAAQRMRLDGESVETEGFAKWNPFRDRGPAFNPDSRDLQGLLVRGYEPLKYSCSIFFRITDADRARVWLKDVLAHGITDASVKTDDLKTKKSALNVAFTASGLRQFGLCEQELATFASPFVEGMTEQRRRRILGDSVTPDTRPAKWRWGGTKTPVDLVLLVFEETAYARDTKRDAWISHFKRVGCGNLVSYEDTYHDKYEHFGFQDGVSQPIIHGTEASQALSWREHRWHAVHPGEFVLGYVDGSGNVCAPPVFGPNDAELGRNGSYLVIRQLAQNVTGFWQYLEQEARARGGNNGNLQQIREQLAAHLVGRRRDGCPLISPSGHLERHKNHPLRRARLRVRFAWDDVRQRATVRWKEFRGIRAPKIVEELRAANSFGFRDDPQGFMCPVGAHMRRANPRDLLGDRRTKALEAANRHRILRRGRLYGTPIDLNKVLEGSADDPPNEERGLLFMCLNSDIARQFEFIQSQWINNPAFDGLYCESDGFVAPTFAGEGRLTSQRDPLRDRLMDLQSFVKVSGGAYFFLPGMRALEYLAADKN
jgi:Dyp-type peroxidase family